MARMLATIIMLSFCSMTTALECRDGLITYECINYDCCCDGGTRCCECSTSLPVWGWVAIFAGSATLVIAITAATWWRRRRLHGQQRVITTAPASTIVIADQPSFGSKSVGYVRM
ncbi:uncharacterized protein LOC134182444 [Corticium candelabrum]|uniref:uncharacterized protein LOC134182444 n=1 Tax=Corticium candelabrum TaxID=121492 RepID=UPI002E25668F|nr:uncharacterized protein LOC134182444 [Corticium candelabrum]